MTHVIRLLLVEDQLINAAVLAQALRRIGFIVSTAGSGEEALLVIDQQPEIELVLMDIGLGQGMDGSLAARLILQKRNLPIVFLTEHADKETLQRVKGITRYGYILKNAGMAVLESSIEIALELFDAYQQVVAKDEQYRTLYATMAQGVIYHTPEGQMLSANPAALHILGLSPETITQRSAYDLAWQAIYPDGTPFPPADFPTQRAVRTGLPVQDVTMGILSQAKDRYTWIKISAVPQFYPGTQRCYQVYATFDDITEQKETSDILESRLRLHEFAPSHSLDELIQATLAEAEKLTGSQIGFYHYIEPDQHTLSRQVWSISTIQGNCQVGQNQLHADIEVAGVWVECVLQRKPVIHNDYAALLHGQGLPAGHVPVVRELLVPVFRGEKIVAVLGVGNKRTNYNERDVQTISLLADLAWDIAETRRQQLALQESTHQYQLLFENMTSGFSLHEVITDPNGQPVDYRFLAANPFFENLTGLKADAIIGKTVKNVIPDIEQIWIETFGQVAITGQPISFDSFSQALNRHYATWAFSPAPGQFAVISTDITERKQAEQELINTKDQLVRARDALEKRIVALTLPLDDASPVAFEDLFNLEDIQRMQDEFAAATGVASIITRPDGVPITRPSSFCRLCIDIIRTTGQGQLNCFRSDAALGRLKADGPTIQPCMSGGLWDAGAGIRVGGKHIANWLIGQVRDETQNEENMRRYAREIGANEDELVKAFHEVPAMTQERFRQIAQALFTLANQLSTTAYQNIQQARFITQQKQNEQHIRALNLELLTAYDATIEGWASTLELRSQETEGHSRRVVDLTITLAVALGISGEECETIRRGAILHDIGKIAIPDSILLKPGPLTGQEWELMRQHPIHAYHLLLRIPFLQFTTDIPYCHHEHWDGSGYPRGLAGQAIPLSARIFSLVDVWDALTNNRPYRPAWDKFEARKYIQQQAGILFDPQITPVFLDLITE